VLWHDVSGCQNPASDPAHGVPADKKLNDLEQFMAEHLHECIRADWVADGAVQLASRRKRNSRADKESIKSDKV